MSSVRARVLTTRLLYALRPDEHKPAESARRPEHVALAKRVALERCFTQNDGATAR